MIQTKLAALAACLVATSALAADDIASTGPVYDLCHATASCDYEIRERLLSVPVWTLVVTRAQRTQLSGEVRFRQQGYKLFADVDTGFKYETEITPVDGGFVCMLSAGPRTYVQVDDAFQAIVGTYIYTIVPPR